MDEKATIELDPAAIKAEAPGSDAAGNSVTADPEWLNWGLLALIKSDIDVWDKLYHPHAGSRRGFRRRLKLIVTFCGLRAVIVFRVSNWLWKKGVPLLPGIVTRHNLIQYGFDITQSIPVGPGLYVPHPVGTVITASRIGANVTIVSGVTIGMRQTPEFPEICDGVFIGAGARVLGGIRIGEHASIGANAVVISDIPAHATAVGIPAKVKTKSPDPA